MAERYPSVWSRPGLWLLVALLLCTLLAGWALGAPRPFPRPSPSPRAAILAARTLCWAGCADRVRFWPDGRYEQRLGERDYFGRWELCGAVLTVREAWISCDGEVSTTSVWTVTLRRDRSGWHGTSSGAFAASVRLEP